MRRASLAPAAALALLACPAPAAANHSPCRWGAGVDVDPERPDPVWVWAQHQFWLCEGPVLVVRVGSRGAQPAPARTAPETAQRRLRLTLSPRRIRVGRTARVRLRALWIGLPDEPAAGVRVRLGRRRVRTGPAGTAVVRVRPRRRGRIVARAGEATATLRVISGRSRSRATRG